MPILNFFKAFLTSTFKSECVSIIRACLVKTFIFLCLIIYKFTYYHSNNMLCPYPCPNFIYSSFQKSIHVFLWKFNSFQNTNNVISKLTFYDYNSHLDQTSLHFQTWKIISKHLIWMASLIPYACNLSKQISLFTRIMNFYGPTSSS